MANQPTRPSRIIQPTSVHATSHVGYSHLARVGQTLYLAGQIALDRDGKLVSAGDVTSHHAYLTEKVPPTEIASLIADLMCFSPSK